MLKRRRLGARRQMSRNTSLDVIGRAHAAQVTPVLDQMPDLLRTTALCEYRRPGIRPGLDTPALNRKTGPTEV